MRWIRFYRIGGSGKSGFVGEELVWIYEALTLTPVAIPFYFSSGANTSIIDKTSGDNPPI
ncbi:MAG: hypothetical protein Kow0060_08780 [Methylohalobius crimeensis]